MFHILNLIALISLPLLLYIFDVVLCINEYNLSRIMLMILPKHFVGRENYFYLIILLLGTATGIGGIAMIATVGTCITYIKHACGMFQIVRWRNICKNKCRNCDYTQNFLCFYLKQIYIDQRKVAIVAKFSLLRIRSGSD